MRAHLLIFGVASLSIAAAAAAEPVKAPVQKAAQTDTRPAPILVASAEEVRQPGATIAAEDGAPVKRQRRARVNSCRCGDQSPNE